MKAAFKRVITYYCLDTIYHQGLAFGTAGRNLIDSGQSSLFVPGMINICLATEIFLKSINATMTYVLDEEVDQPNGIAFSTGRDDTLVIAPGGQGHHLSKLFEKLPNDAKESIRSFVNAEGYAGDIADGLRQYDKVFVEWRYIYEKNDPGVLGTHPLFHISNAIDAYCRSKLGQMRGAVDEVFNDPVPDSVSE